MSIMTYSEGINELVIPPEDNVIFLMLFALEHNNNEVITVSYTNIKCMYLVQ